MDGVTFAVNGVRLLRSGAEMTFSLSKNGQTLLAQGSAVLGRHIETGLTLPVLKDVRTGKIIEWMKGTGSTLTTIGAASAAVVTAAHMIAGADIARRMKQVESKLDLLLQYRRIDQIAKLERIYTSAKELSSGRMDQDKCWELWRLRGELRELRCTWRQELHHHLSQITDPKNDSYFERMFSSQQTMDGKVQQKVTEGQLHIEFMEYSLRLDHVFAIVGGTINEFEGTLTDELSELGKLAVVLRSKVDLIKVSSPQLEVEPTLKRMMGVVDAFKGLLPAPTVIPIPSTNCRSLTRHRPDRGPARVFCGNRVAGILPVETAA